LILVKGVKEEVWTFRYYQQGPDGKRRYLRLRIGTRQEYPTKVAAMRVVEGLRCAANNGSLQRQSFSFGGLIERYLREELPERFSTRRSYSSMLKRWIRPQWDTRSLEEIKPMDVEHWLKSLALAPKTKANLRNLMHVLYECARTTDLWVMSPMGQS
jgi:hypothetical protein